MELNLKRALKLRKELELVLAKVDIPVSVNMSLLGDIDIQASLEAARTEVQAQIVQFRQLSTILSGLRISLADRNVTHQIEKMLAETAHIDRSINIARKLAVAAITPSDSELSAEVTFGKRALEAPVRDDEYNGYGRAQKTVTISTTSQEIHDEAIQTINELKRSRESLEDQRTYTNSYAKVTLADEDAELLRKVGLL